jgi:hypothetical protein
MTSSVADEVSASTSSFRSRPSRGSARSDDGQHMGGHRLSTKQTKSRCGGYIPRPLTFPSPSCGSRRTRMGPPWLLVVFRSVVEGDPRPAGVAISALGPGSRNEDDWWTRVDQDVVRKGTPQ